jgi:hypothetical protein
MSKSVLGPPPDVILSDGGHLPAQPPCKSFPVVVGLTGLNEGWPPSPSAYLLLFTLSLPIFLFSLFLFLHTSLLYPSTYAKILRYCPLSFSISLSCISLYLRLFRPLSLTPVLFPVYLDFHRLHSSSYFCRLPFTHSPCLSSFRNYILGSGSGFNFNFGRGSGSGLFMENTFELQII